MHAAQPMLWEESRLKTLYRRRRVLRFISILFTLVFFPIVWPVNALKAFVQSDAKEIRELEHDVLLAQYDEMKNDRRLAGMQ